MKTETAAELRFYVTEIVLPLGLPDVIFRRERSDDRKYVCGSQANFSYVFDFLSFPFLIFVVVCFWWRGVGVTFVRTSFYTG